MHGALLVTIGFLLAGSVSPQHGGVSKVGTAPVELKASVEELSNEAMLGDALAASKLSDYFRYEKNDELKWKYWALVAAENGDPASQFDEYSILGSSDDLMSQRRALYWLKKSAHGGYSPANIELKACFPSGSFDGRKVECMGASTR